MGLRLHLGAVGAHGLLDVGEEVGPEALEPQQLGPEVDALGPDGRASVLIDDRYGQRAQMSHRVDDRADVENRATLAASIIALIVALVSTLTSWIPPPPKSRRFSVGTELRKLRLSADRGRENFSTG
jgi:hypothetical protein